MDKVFFTKESLISPQNSFIDNNVHALNEAIDEANGKTKKLYQFVGTVVPGKTLEGIVPDDLSLGRRSILAMAKRFSQVAFEVSLTKKEWGALQLLLNKPRGYTAACKFVERHKTFKKI